MIRLENVSKCYPTAEGVVRAVDHLSVQIDQGEFVAVRGASGCGKSTLLSMVGGLGKPTSGRVIVDDHDLSSLSETQSSEFRSRTIGFVFQAFHLLPYLTVYENVVSASVSTDQESGSAIALDLLKRFGLEGRLTHLPGQLSAGERQRVAMARAMLNQPKIILADEPTGNLDPKNSSGVLELLKEFHSDGGTVLLVTHDETAAAYAQRSICLENGSLVPDQQESSP